MKIIIDIQFGSFFQKEVWGQAIVSMIAAWQSMMMDRHKKNKVKVEIIENE